MLLAVFRYLMVVFMACFVTGCEKPFSDDSFEDEPIEDGLVRVRVDVKNAKQDAAVLSFANCTAARYAIDRGFAFARHIMSTLDYKFDLKSAEAVYLLSATLPPGSKKLDVEVVAINCAENGIPMV
jgi:hypothetical protein